MARVLVDDQVTAASKETDRELVLRCQQGDCGSFRKLYQRYNFRVRSTLYQLCGEQMLDDLVQEVFLRTWRGLPKLREVSYFSTWLYRISWNVAVDRRRQLARLQKQQSRQILDDKEDRSLDDVEQTLNNHLSHSQNAPDLMQLHYQDLVQRGLQTLSFEHRAVLILHDLEDLPQKEIANILNIPLGTVKSRLFHARSLMKKFFQQQGVSL